MTEKPGLDAAPGEGEASGGTGAAGGAAHPPPAPPSLQPVMNVPVRVRAVLGRARMDLNRLLRLRAGEIIELDRRPGEPVEIFVNNRFVARGEVVLIDEELGVTLTEIARQDL
ncbi:flagellar motor switch protein FliN [Sphingomonas morindae]|uniref:Flagellar motor switch protein FliN n=1 Tax=Sphingomonas morindae TaxID=1541170 RepID=A0ABY4X8K4_9SPHN|nr:flagellar motor switch protein FliN [Sphingomonas morindae]USI73267.1 flagellar motor switch protein FliN [Sphingomonas morindae]